VGAASWNDHPNQRSTCRSPEAAVAKRASIRYTSGVSRCWPAVLLTSLVITSPAPASDRAHPVTPIVFRTFQAETCVDAAALGRTVSRLRGESQGLDAFEVNFSKKDGAWRAELVPRDDPTRVRVLEDESPSCHALGEAVAFTLVMLLTDEARAKEAPAREPQTSLPPEEARAIPPHPPMRRARLWIGAGAGASFGIVSSVAPIATAAAALDVRQYGALVRFTYTPAQRFELSPGTVEVEAYQVGALGCFGDGARRALRYWACLGAEAGVAHAQSNGYPMEGEAARPYGAGLAELRGILPLGSTFGISASGTLSVPWVRQSFSITGIGSAYVPPLMGGRIELQLMATLPEF